MRGQRERESSGDEERFPVHPGIITVELLLPRSEFAGLHLYLTIKYFFGFHWNEIPPVVDVTTS